MKFLWSAVLPTCWRVAAAYGEWDSSLWASALTRQWKRLFSCPIEHYHVWDTVWKCCLSVLKTKYFVASTFINSSRVFQSFFFWVWTCWLLVLLAFFLLAEELNEQCRACFIAFQSIRTSRGINKQHGSPSVSLSPVWGMLSRGKQIHFTLEDAGVFLNAVVVWRIRSRKEHWNIFGKKKYKTACFLLQSKWVHFYFCFGKLLKAKLYWTQCYFSVCFLNDGTVSWGEEASSERS